MAGEPARHGNHLEFLAHLHEERDAALLLSRDGCRRNAEWIPRSLTLEPRTTQLVKIEGEPSQRGIFYIAIWKAREIGWADQEDERQLRLVV